MRTQINNSLLLAVAMLAGFTSFCSAQNTETGSSPLRSVRFGFKASPNFNWVNVMEGRVKSNGTALGISYGIMGDFNIAGNENYWISSEVIVTSMPAKIAALDTLYITNNSLSAPYTNVQFDYKLQYIQIPISLKLKTAEIGNFVYYGQLGLCPSFMIQNRLTTVTKESFYQSGTTAHSPNSSNNDGLDFNGKDNKGAFQDNVIPLRMSMILGAGIEVPISGKTTATFGIRFDNGFTNLFWDKAVKGRNNYLGLNAGVFF